MTTGHYTCSVKRKIDRQDIINAGKELMFLNGYNATGIKDITSSIDIPKGSFYNHFESKEQFALEMLEQYCETGIARHDRVLRSNNEPPFQRLYNFYDAMVNRYCDNGQFDKGCLMSNFSAEMADVNENFRTLLDREFNGCQSAVAFCLEEGIKAGEFRTGLDAEATASFIVSSWHGALVRMKSSGNESPLYAFRDSMFSLIKS